MWNYLKFIRAFSRNYNLRLVLAWYKIYKDYCNLVIKNKDQKKEVFNFLLVTSAQRQDAYTYFFLKYSYLTGLSNDNPFKALVTAVAEGSAGKEEEDSAHGQFFLDELFTKMTRTLEEISKI